MSIITTVALLSAAFVSPPSFANAPLSQRSAPLRLLSAENEDAKIMAGIETTKASAVPASSKDDTPPPVGGAPPKSSASETPLEGSGGGSLLLLLPYFAIPLLAKLIEQPPPGQ